MQKFKVNISEGVSQIVEAENANEARQKVKAEIAKGEIGAEIQKEENKVLDDLFNSIKGIKTAEDQDSVMENKVGNNGFVRNTKGQLALTPEGLEDLGLPVQQKKLADRRFC